MAQYYLAPLGEVLRGMLPLMAEVRRTVYYRITDLGRDVLAGSMDGESGNLRCSRTETWGRIARHRSMQTPRAELSPRSRTWSTACSPGWLRASR